MYGARGKMVKEREHIMEHMGKKVTVFGSFVVDLMGRTPHLPAAGETVKGTVFKMGPGGQRDSTRGWRPTRQERM